MAEKIMQDSSKGDERNHVSTLKKSCTQVYHRPLMKFTILFIYLFICLLVYLFVCLFICLFVYLFIYLFI